MQVITSDKFKQGSDEWKLRRVGSITSSTAAAILGLSSFMTQREAFFLIMHLIEEPPSTLLQLLFDHGHRVEPIARDAFVRSTGLYVETGVALALSQEHAFLMASPDGVIPLFHGRKCVLEIKAPAPPSHPWFKTDFSDDFIREKLTLQYIIQNIVQMECNAADACFHIYYREASTRVPEKQTMFFFVMTDPLRKEILNRLKSRFEDITAIPPVKERPYARGERKALLSYIRKHACIIGPMDVSARSINACAAFLEDVLGKSH